MRRPRLATSGCAPPFWSPADAPPSFGHQRMRPTCESPADAAPLLWQVRRLNLLLAGDDPEEFTARINRARVRSLRSAPYPPPTPCPPSLLQRTNCWRVRSDPTQAPIPLKLRSHSTHSALMMFIIATDIATIPIPCGAWQALQQQSEAQLRQSIRARRASAATPHACAQLPSDKLLIRVLRRLGRLTARQLESNRS
jgi:hypothetical protein